MEDTNYHHEVHREKKYMIQRIEKRLGSRESFLLHCTHKSKREKNREKKNTTVVEIGNRAEEETVKRNEREEVESAGR